MDVYVGTMHSTVRAVDGESLLTPELLDRIVRAVLVRLADERDRARRGEAERELRDTRIEPPYIGQAYAEPGGGQW